MTSTGAPVIRVAALEDPAYAREHADTIDVALARLGCNPSASFRSFFRTYAGPFHGARSGFMLLDLVDQVPNIETQTMDARTVHGFAPRYLVLSDLLAHAVLVYDCETDAVLDVDFEGGDRALPEGRLAPTWSSFETFLADFFDRNATKSGTLHDDETRLDHRR